MKIQFSIILVLAAYACTAQQFSEEDIQRLKLYCRGEFATTDTAISKQQRRLTVKPFWEKRKDGLWLFVTEKAQKETITVEDFFVWHFYRESNEVLLLQLLQFKDKMKAIELANINIKDTSIFLSDLKSMNSCELYFKKDKLNNYEGRSKGKDCYIESTNSEYIEFGAVLKNDCITWGSKGFDKDDKQVMGPGEGYNYKRVVTAKKK
jgi:hypothetical protein